MVEQYLDQEEQLTLPLYPSLLSYLVIGEMGVESVSPLKALNPVQGPYRAELLETDSW